MLRYYSQLTIRILILILAVELFKRKLGGFSTVQQSKCSKLTSYNTTATQFFNFKK